MFNCIETIFFITLGIALILFMLLIVHLKKQIIEIDETKNKILVICTKLSSDIRQIQLERRNEVKMVQHHPPLEKKRLEEIQEKDRDDDDDDDDDHDHDDDEDDDEDEDNDDDENQLMKINVSYDEKDLGSMVVDKTITLSTESFHKLCNLDRTFVCIESFFDANNLMDYIEKGTVETLLESESESETESESESESKSKSESESESEVEIEIDVEVEMEIRSDLDVDVDVNSDVNVDVNLDVNVDVDVDVNVDVELKDEMSLVTLDKNTTFDKNLNLDDLKKLNLSSLKTLIISKGLSSDPSKLKKNEMLKMLSKI